MSITERLDITYGIEPGVLSPYIDGLRAGQAVARRCRQCGRVSFPPDRTCRCGAQDFVWSTLSGLGRLLVVTTIGGQQVALVQFKGADNSALARVIGDQCREGQPATIVASASSPSDWPTLDVITERNLRSDTR